MTRLIMHFIIFTIFISSLTGCDSFTSPEIKGIVIDKFSKQPIVGAAIIAETKTNIEQDKKYELIKTTSDSSGNFILKNLSNKYTYRIKVSKAGYFDTAESNTSSTPPQSGETKLLEKALLLIKQKAITGKITDTFSMKPISGVKIIAKNNRKRRDGGSLEPIEAITDQDGIYSLSFLYPEQVYDLSYSKHGYSSINFEISDNGIGKRLEEKHLIKLPSGNSDFIITSNYDYIDLNKPFIGQKSITLCMNKWTPSYLDFPYFSSNSLANIKKFKKNDVLYYATIQNKPKNREVYQKSIAPLGFQKDLTMKHRGGYGAKYKNIKSDKHNFYLMCYDKPEDLNNEKIVKYYAIDKTFKTQINRNSVCNQEIEFHSVLLNKHEYEINSSRVLVLIDISSLPKNKYGSINLSSLYNGVPYKLKDKSEIYTFEIN